MNHPRAVTVWWSGGRVEVLAHPTPVPGLLVHQGHLQPGTWVVLHEASGATILRLPDPEAALHAAIRLGELADWLLPGRALRERPGLQPRIWSLARELGCYEMSFSCRPISDAELAVTEVTP